jgi:hypothetical protein
VILVQFLQHSHAIGVKLEFGRFQHAQSAQLESQGTLAYRELRRVGSIQAVHAVRPDDSRLHGSFPSETFLHFVLDLIPLVCFTDIRA